VAVLSALLAVGVPAVGAGSPAHASDSAGRTADGVITFVGRGFGHGRGMSQYGAYGAALRGLNHAQILAFYYSDTVLGTADGARRRVLLTKEDADAVVTNAPGLVLRDGEGREILRPGDSPGWSRVRVRADGGVVRTEVESGGSWIPAVGPFPGPVVLSGPPVLSLHTPTGVRGYRGTLTAALSGQGSKPLYVVSTVGIDDYVRGVVAAEMPASWPAPALQAQAVAARSYGLQRCWQSTSYPGTAHYDVVDTISCQVYGGVDAETPSTDAAVAATSRQVVRYGGNVLRTEFSSSNGGWTVAAGGAFQAKPDPYDAVGAEAGRSTVHRWTGVRVPASTLEARFGTGTLREVRVLSRNGDGEWGGRVLTVRLVGDTRTVDVTGEQVRSAAGLRSSWFDLVTPIDAKHGALGGDAGLLGPAVTAETGLVGGRFRGYRNGSIYWTPSVGAHEVHGLIRDRWGALGYETGPLGYPTTDETPTPDRVGRYNHFQAGSVYWSPATGAYEVRGAIRERWSGLGWERSPLGYPTTDERVTPDGRGRYNHFQVGSVYWSPATGAHDVRGAIRSTWAQNGWEAGPLGYPVSGEYAVPGGRRSDFQRGSIVWDAATGVARVR